MKKFKLYTGYYLSLSCFLFLFWFMTLPFITSYSFSVLFDNGFFFFLAMNFIVAGNILFFWMQYNLIQNKEIKYKFLWFLSFFVMLIGAIAYFWFIYRKNNQEIKGISIT